MRPGKVAIDPFEIKRSEALPPEGGYTKAETSAEIETPFLLAPLFPLALPAPLLATYSILRIIAVEFADRFLRKVFADFRGLTQTKIGKSLPAHHMPGVVDLMAFYFSLFPPCPLFNHFCCPIAHFTPIFIFIFNSFNASLINHSVPPLHPTLRKSLQ